MATLIRFLVVLALPTKVAELIKFCNAVILALTNNKWFPTPLPTLAVLTAAVASLETAETGAVAKAKGAADLRDSLLVTLLSLMHQLRAYVQSIVDLNLSAAAEIATSAGMRLRKKPVRPPRVFAAKQGPNSGEVILVAPGAGVGATHYWGFGTDGKTFQSVPETHKATTTISNLIPGTTYYFRHKTLTPKGGESDWGQTISFMVK